MAQRTEALYKGQLIGIETIYSVHNGKQINIPDKVEDLRLKSRRKELFCPCGCGLNLTLVAGDKMQREQHFRIHHDSELEADKDCTYIAEGIGSISDKIVLKCWLEEKLNHPAITSRVPISSIRETRRKFELSFWIPERKLAISYCHLRENLSDEKISVLDEELDNVTILRVIGWDRSAGGQYPEWSMKVQKRQGYNLHLMSYKGEYAKALLEVSFYEKTPYGTWKENVVCSGLLSSYSLGSDNALMFENQQVHGLFVSKKNEFDKWFSNEVRKIEDEKEKQRQRAEKVQQELERKRIQAEQEAIRKQEELVRREQARVQAIEEAKKIKEAEETAKNQRVQNEINEYLESHPKQKAVLEFLNATNEITAKFLAFQSDGTQKEYYRTLTATDKPRIEIKKDRFRFGEAYIYIRQLNDTERKQLGFTGALYFVVDLSQVEMEEITQRLEETFRSF